MLEWRGQAPLRNLSKDSEDCYSNETLASSLIWVGTFNCAYNLEIPHCSRVSDGKYLAFLRIQGSWTVDLQMLQHFFLQNVSTLLPLDVSNKLAYPCPPSRTTDWEVRHSFYTPFIPYSILTSRRLHRCVNGNGSYRRGFPNSYESSTLTLTRLTLRASQMIGSSAFDLQLSALIGHVQRLIEGCSKGLSIHPTFIWPHGQTRRRFLCLVVCLHLQTN